MVLLSFALRDKCAHWFSRCSMTNERTGGTRKKRKREVLEGLPSFHRCGKDLYSENREVFSSTQGPLKSPT